MDSLDRVELQIKRRAAYEDSEYTLDDWEGYTCPECGNRQLFAEFNTDDADPMFEPVCGECGSVTETSDKQTDWDAVREKIPEEYMTGDATETDLPVCPHCKEDIREEDGAVQLSVGEESTVLHERCGEAIWEKQIENPFWYDSFTPEHYEKVADYLRSLDCIGEVITNDGNLYPFGEMYIHTNFCTTSVVEDIVDSFGARIVSAGVSREGDRNAFDCVDTHGTCFEILIDFCTDSAGLTPPEYLDRYSQDDEPPYTQDHFLIDYDREPFFDADFSKVPDKEPESVPEKHRE